jgi:hypothetical protein
VDAAFDALMGDLGGAVAANLTAPAACRDGFGPGHADGRTLGPGRFASALSGPAEDTRFELVRV